MTSIQKLHLLQTIRDMVGQVNNLIEIYNKEEPQTIPLLEVELKKCPTCESIEQDGGFGPSHNGSKNCKSGSIASGGNYSHCSCDTCF